MYGQIHDALCKKILEIVEKPEPLNAAEITAISKFLKDNNYSALPEYNTTIQKIAEKLHQRDDDEADDGHIPFPLSK